MKLRFILLILSVFAMNALSDPAPIRVLVWDERQPEQAQAYENFLGNAIAAHLAKQPGFTVKSVGLNDPEQGLDTATLEATDVLVWWGHRRHPDVNHETVRGIIERIKAGRLSLIALHSAHWSQPFTEAMYARAIEDAMRTIPKAERATRGMEDRFMSRPRMARRCGVVPAGTRRQATRKGHRSFLRPHQSR